MGVDISTHTHTNARAHASLNSKAEYRARLTQTGSKPTFDCKRTEKCPLVKSTAFDAPARRLTKARRVKLTKAPRHADKGPASS